ncbi:MAG: hypothetical protein IT207_01260 [Fimbriimonadaceae bacterium]|nr:hypothetical protein [Fimbriimonadaceae bacterium]
MAGQLYLGLDGGGTSTNAACLDDTGRLVFQGSGGPGNVATANIEELLASIAEATQGCPACVSVAACLAGATAARTPNLEDEVSAMFPCAKVLVRPDWAAPLYASAEESAAVVIAGTGSAVCSKRNGQERVTLGGGALVGDLGSALDVARRYLGALLVCGHDPAEPVGSALGESFGTQNPREVASRWREPRFIQMLAACANSVAESNDPLATRAVDGAMDALAHAAQVHLDAIGHPGGNTVVESAGGLWGASPKFMERFRWALSVTGEGTVHRHYVVKPLAVTPAEGAARLAQWSFHGN